MHCILQWFPLSVRRVQPACWGTHNPHPCILFLACWDVQFGRTDSISAISLAESLTLVQGWWPCSPGAGGQWTAGPAAPVHLARGVTARERLRWCAVCWGARAREVRPVYEIRLIWFPPLIRLSEARPRASFSHQSCPFFPSCQAYLAYRISVL